MNRDWLITKLIVIKTLRILIYMIIYAQNHRNSLLKVDHLHCMHLFYLNCLWQHFVIYTFRNLWHIFFSILPKRCSLQDQCWNTTNLLFIICHILVIWTAVSDCLSCKGPDRELDLSMQVWLLWRSFITMLPHTNAIIICTVCKVGRIRCVHVSVDNFT